MNINSLNPQQSYKVGIIIIPNLQIKKMEAERLSN